MPLAARAFCLVVHDSRASSEHLALETIRDFRPEVEALAAEQAAINRGEFGRPWESVVGIAAVEIREERRLPIPTPVAEPP